jgi:hypothetical protein
MGQLTMLILPVPADLDAIRACLDGKFALNPKVEGLGDVEELQATNEAGRVTIFETVPGPLSEMLRNAMRERSLAPDDFKCFWARYGWATSEAALLCAAEALHGWLYDTWNRLLSPEEFRQTLKSPANRPVG